MTIVYAVVQIKSLWSCFALKAIRTSVTFINGNNKNMTLHDFAKKTQIKNITKIFKNITKIFLKKIFSSIVAYQNVVF